MYKKTLLLLGILTSFNLYAQEIYDTKWVLCHSSNIDSLNRELSIFIPQDKTYILGDSGCNNFYIPIQEIKQSDQQYIFTTKELVSHDLNCDGKIMENEKKFQNAFSNQNIWIRKDIDSLFIGNDQKQRMVFTSEKIDRLRDYIQDNSWKLIQINQTDLNPESQLIYFQLNLDDHYMELITPEMVYFAKVYLNKTNTKISFETFYACNNLVTKKAPDTVKQVVSLLEKKTFDFDIADQTFNIYKDNKLILIFASFKPDSNTNWNQESTALK
ncbi:META domain-containing protein [Myroides sp. LJL119]